MIRRTLTSVLFIALIAAVKPACPAQPVDFDGAAPGANISLPTWKTLGVSGGTSPRAGNSAEIVFTMDNMVPLNKALPNFQINAQKPHPLDYFDSDVPADIQKQLRDDMAFVKSILGTAASELHKKIFGPMDGPTYGNFFESRVKSVGMSTCGNPIAVACVMPFFYPSKIWLTQNYIQFSHPQIARLMIVFHESRHTESANGNWPHANCPNPFLDENGQDIHSIWTGSLLADQPACDITPLGSYGSSLIMLKNIQKFCANCTDKVRMDAGLYADDQFKRIISADAKKAIRDDLYQ